MAPLIIEFWGMYWRMQEDVQRAICAAERWRRWLLLGLCDFCAA